MNMMKETESTDQLVRVATVAEVEGHGCIVVHVKGHSIALILEKGQVYAMDSRCPHMGFPLQRGTVQDGVLTCHWHHARFDLASGGCFDQFAGDVRVFPVQIREGEVWVDVAPQQDPKSRQGDRLQVGMERDIPLTIGKAVIMLLDLGEDPAEPFRIGLDFGVRYRSAGWGQGLTMHTCLMNVLPYLQADDRPRALYHGLSAISRECAGAPPRFPIRPLPQTTTDPGTFKRWFRQFVEVRDAEGAERCIVSAVRAGASRLEMADMLFSAVTDHRYIQIGHVADFTNKAFEALEVAGWEHAESVLSSLATAYANAGRMEESNSWRHPIDLIEILQKAFDALPAALEFGRGQRGRWSSGEELADLLLGEDPKAIADGLLEAVRQGAVEDELAGAVAYAAALRVARFHVSNEFADWDTALHTFTFANAIQQGLRLIPSPELLRGVFDAAMSVYLDRFLNMPPASLPQSSNVKTPPEALLDELTPLLDHRQRSDHAGKLVADFLYGGGDPNLLLTRLGKLLLREDRDFHTIQMVEASIRQYESHRGAPSGTNILVAAARYLAAHSPTVRAQDQTYVIAHRLHQGEHIYEE